MEERARLAQQQQVWEGWAREDPMWAVNSDTALRGKWQADAFFASGHESIKHVSLQLDEHGLAPASGRCLDFGCGLGRLTQALAERYGRADGVDVSETMIEQARRHNTHGDACTFHVNVSDDLSLFESDAFDLVFSTMVLQHIHPDDARRYIAEFVRVTRPGGVIVFDEPEKILERNIAPGGHVSEVSIGRVPTAFAGEALPVPVRVRNASPHDWPASMTIRVGNHWADATTGEVRVLDDARVALLDGLPAGSAIDVVLNATAPTEPGRWSLLVDIVEEGVAWFVDLDQQPAETTVKVRTRRFGRRVGTADPGPEPAMFTMNALPQAEVEAVVTAAGGHIVATEPTLSAGKEWEAHRYFVVVD